MKFTVTITCDNDAFGETAEDAEREIASLLATLAKRVGKGDVRNRIGRTQYHNILDTNGNSVGVASFTYDPTEERR